MNLKSVYSLLLIVFLMRSIVFLQPGITRLVILLVIGIELSRLFIRSVIYSNRNDWVKNLFTLLYSACIIVLLSEGAFMFIRRPNAVGNTLASKAWFNEYWHLNSYGFRDQSNIRTNAPGVLFVGDSFTAGHGIENTKDRFSDVFKAELQNHGKSTNVYNLGIQGADTFDEFEAMQKFINQTHIKPKGIVLQYFGNDIEKVAEKNNLKMPPFQPYTDLNTVTRSLVKSSYFFNYLYWLIPAKDYSNYFNFLSEGYSNKSIFKLHKYDILRFSNYRNSKNIPLCVVVFPFMHDLKLSERVYINPLVNFFEANKINYINVSHLVSNLPLDERVINLNDGHASVLVNKLVGKAIYNNISPRL